MNGSHFTIFIFHQFESPMNGATNGRRISRQKNWCAVLTECRPTVQRRLAATPSWLLFESDRYSQCIYNTPDIIFFRLVMHFPSIMCCCWVTQRERCRARTHIQTLTRCHYNKLRCASKMIYCQNVGARGRCDLRDSPKFMNVMHIDKRRHTHTLNRIYKCTMCVHQCCVRDVLLHILCARCCPSNIYPSVRSSVGPIAHSNAFSVTSMIQCLWILFENGYDKWLFISFNHGIVVSPCPPLPIDRTNVTRCDAPLSASLPMQAAHSALFHLDKFQLGQHFGFKYV